MNTTAKKKFELIDGKHQKWGEGTLFDSVEEAQAAADLGRKYTTVLQWYYSPPGVYEVDFGMWHGKNVKEHWVIKEVLDR